MDKLSKCAVKTLNTKFRRKKYKATMKSIKLYLSLDLSFEKALNTLLKKSLAVFMIIKSKTD